MNAGQLRGPKVRNFLIALFLFTGALLIAGVILFQQRIGNSSVFAIRIELMNVCVGGILYSLQKPKYGKWRAEGNKWRSLFIPIVVTIGVAMVLSIPTLISDFRSPVRPTTAELNDHGNRVIYDVSIGETEASKIATELEKAGLFSDDSQITVLVRDKAQYEMLIPINRKSVGTKETKDLLRQLSEYVNANGALKKQLVIFEADASFNKLE